MGPPSETTDNDRSRPEEDQARTPAQNAECDLVVRARDGDLLAFAILLEAHEPLVLELCLRILHHEAETKIVVDEILLTVWRRLESLREPADFSSWLFWIAAHHSHFVLRGQPPRSPQPGSFTNVVGPPTRTGSSFLDVEPLMGMYAEIRAQASALLAVSLEVHLTWMLHDVDGQTPAEIAEILKVSPHRVRERIRQAQSVIARAGKDRHDIQISSPQPQRDPAPPNPSS